MLFTACFISLLSVIYALPSQKNSTDGCTVQAWVRAPDLEPNKVISGEYRVRVNGSDCAINKASLVLRLDEHSSVRYVKPEGSLPSLPDISDRRKTRFNDMWELGPVAWFGAAVLTEDEFKQIEAYKAGFKNDSLWVDKSILQTEFVAEQPIDTGNGTVTGSFAIAVPNTNYPPGLRFNIYSSSNGQGSANARYAYRYLVIVEHANGTIESVPAGYTSFHPVLPMLPGPQQQTKVVSEFKRDDRGCNREDCRQKAPACANQNGNFTAQITLPSRTFKRGANIVGSLRIVSNGSDERVSRVEQFLFLNQNRTWVRSVLPSSMNETEQELLANRDGFVGDQELYPQSDSFSNRWGRDSGVDLDPNQLTWSVPINVSINDDVVPTFNSSLNAFYHHLLIRIYTVFLCDYKPVEEDNEWEEHVSNGWSTRSLTVTLPIAVVTSADDDFSPIHYLADGAKSPFFISMNQCDQVSKLSALQRDDMAPQARRQQDINPPSKNTRKHVHPPFDPWKEAYVGQIWRKKMSLLDKKGSNPLVFQTA